MPRLHFRERGEEGKRKEKKRKFLSKNEKRRNFGEKKLNWWKNLKRWKPVGSTTKLFTVVISHLL